MDSKQSGRQAAIWMITAAFCFASMGAFAHTAGSRCDWFLIALFRIICTFVFSVLLAWASRSPLVLFSPRTLWLRSVTGTISLICTFYAVTRLPVADVLTLTNTYPLWIVLLSLPHLRRAEFAIDLLCVISGVVGVALIQRPYLSGKGDVAVLAALIASFTTAVAMLGLHRLRTVAAPAVVAHFAGLASVTFSVWITVHPRSTPLSTFDTKTGLLLLGVGLSGTMGQVFLTKAFAAGPPSRISVLSLTQVVFAMAYDAAIEGRVLTLSTIAGFVLVLTPTAWITLRAGGATAEPAAPA